MAFWSNVLLGALVVVALILVGLIFRRLVCGKLEFFTSDDPKLNQLRALMVAFFDRHRGTWSEPTRSLIENRDVMAEISLTTAAKSYTINKQAVHMCMTEADGEYYPDNTLIYVLAHELAHVICDETGHTPKYNAIFQQILDKLEKDGLYDPSIHIDRDYCLWSGDE